MEHYKRLSGLERENISVLLHQKKSYGEIGKVLNRNKSTISREVKRNAVERFTYTAYSAQKFTVDRAGWRNNKRKITIKL